MPISLLTLNIEGDNHLDKIQQLIDEKHPDVVCFQEIYKADLPIFQKQLQVKSVFVPSSRIESENKFRLKPKGEWGVAIFSRIPLFTAHIHAYVGELNHVPVYENGEPNLTNRVVIVAKFHLDNKPLYIATTHFTWADKGDATELQHKNLDQLLQVVESYRPLVFCGDFNAPRGKSVFERLATEFTDNIPTHVTSSIDPDLHRVKGIELMVDGMFSSPGIHVNDVEVIQGVSDHKAVFGRISFH